MKTIIGALVVAFSLTILISCSQDYSSPTSENKSQTGVSKSETKTETKSETKSETAPAATPEATDAKKTDSVSKANGSSAEAPSSTTSSATSPSATGPSGSASGSSAKRTSSTVADKKAARSAERSGAMPDRASTKDQADVPPQPTIGVEQITSNRMQTIEGVVLKIEGDSYLVKDLAGNEVKLRADNKTKKDSNLTVGDKILARLEGPGVAAASITKR